MLLGLELKVNMDAENNLIESKNVDIPPSHNCVEEMDTNRPICVVHLKVERSEVMDITENGALMNVKDIKSESYSDREYVRKEQLQDTGGDALINVENIKREVVEWQLDIVNDELTNNEHLKQEPLEETDLERNRLTGMEAVKEELLEEKALVEIDLATSEEEVKQKTEEVVENNMTKESKDFAIPKKVTERSRGSREVNKIPKVRKVPKTGAERTREYRARIQALKYAAAARTKSIKDVAMPKKVTERSRGSREGKTSKVKKVAKTPAERMREYRARIRALEDAAAARSATNVEVMAIQIAPQQNLEDSQVDMRKNQRSLLYKALCRQGSQDEQETGDNHRQFDIQLDTHQHNLPLLSEAPSTNIQMQSSTHKMTTLRQSKTAKTSAERARAYRERRKALNNAPNEQLIIDLTHSHDDDMVVLEDTSQEAINIIKKQSTSTACSRQCKGRKQPNEYIKQTSNSARTSKGVARNKTSSPAEIRPFECDVCQRRFTNKSRLTEHLRIHTGDKPFQCGICQQGFTVIDDLSAHLRTHTSYKPIKCEICQRKFPMSYNLSIHLNTHGVR